MPLQSKLRSWVPMCSPQAPRLPPLLVLLLPLIAAGAAGEAVTASAGGAEAAARGQGSVREALAADADCQVGCREGGDASSAVLHPARLEDEQSTSLLQRSSKAVPVTSAFGQARLLEVGASTKVLASAPPRVPDRAVGPARPLTRAELRAEKLKVYIPLGAIAVGGLCILAGHKTLGLIAVYFGSQSGLSLYMKVVLSEAVISKELELNGIPAPFLVTGAQQLVAFIVIIPICIVAGFAAPSSRGFRQLTTQREWVGVAAFSAAFAANFGLNNLSLSLIAVSLNLIIRSCLPIVTLGAQLLVGALFPGSKEASMRVKRSEVMFMLTGMAFAGIATVAGGAGGEADEAGDPTHYLFGVLVCVGSCFAAALNLVIARFLGKGMDLDPMEATLYTSLPSGFFLVVPALFAPHPVAWPHYSLITDWQVFMKIIELSPQTLGLVLLSGVFAALYNILQYLLVQYLSATHTAFCGNFNKAATIFLSIALGLEKLPEGIWGLIMILSVLGNILSFSGFSLMKAQERKGFCAESSADTNSYTDSRPPSSVGSHDKLPALDSVGKSSASPEPVR